MNETLLAGTAGEGDCLTFDWASSEQRLLPQAEFGDDFEVFGPVGLPEVLKQTGTLANELQQPAATGKIFLVRPHVFGQVVDPVREQCNLHCR